MAVWWGTPLECESALARGERLSILSVHALESGRRQLDTLRAAWAEVGPSDAVREGAGVLLRRYPLRAADALQIAAALVWAEDHPEGESFMTLDKRRADAARTEGFEVVHPGEPLG
jgi:predicted nucleic acid-binding protein